MKKILIGLLALASISSYADIDYDCTEPLQSRYEGYSLSVNFDDNEFNGIAVLYKYGEQHATGQADVDLGGPMDSPYLIMMFPNRRFTSNRIGSIGINKDDMTAKNHVSNRSFLGKWWRRAYY